MYTYIKELCDIYLYRYNTGYLYIYRKVIIFIIQIVKFYIYL
jgi:hypothetical protein